MRNIWTIALREFKAYFVSPVAYIVAAVIFLVIGILFSLVMISTMQQFGQGGAPGAQLVTNPLMFVLVFTCPAITMRLLSEEQRLGTLELLLTAPVRDWEVVVGKWLGSLMFVLAVVAVTWIYPIILNQMVDPGIDQGLLVTGYLGVVLVTAAFLGIGIAVSSLFSNQVASFLTTFGILVMLWWLLGIGARYSGSLGSTIFNYLDFSRQFYDVFSQGVIELSSVIYMLSITALSLFLCTVSVEMRRWR